MKDKKIGYYCWGGPGLIRMTKLKYFNPRIDYKSIMRAYDKDYLYNIKKKFGVTDFWATYSWGFDYEIEKEDYEFILRKLENFHHYDIKIHAYVQGPNLIYKDFKNKNFWAVDERGRLISYHRGRKVCCINNPNFKLFIEKKVKKACQYDFDGIFIDNIQMGQLAIPSLYNDPVAFIGCRCGFCLKRFKKITGENIPRILRKDKISKEYLKFRVKSTNEFMKSLSEIVRSNQKEFGSNSFDPKYDTQYVFGTDLNYLDKIQDYILFENHSFPNKDLSRNNLYIDKFIENEDIKSDVFVVSYKRGIGLDHEFSQDDIDRVFSEHNQSRFHACLKGSEFITDGKWHNLTIENFTKPNIEKLNTKYKVDRIATPYIAKLPILKQLFRFYYNRLYTWFMEIKWFRNLFERLVFKNI